MSSHLEVGIVGLPNVGKSTLFNAMTKIRAEAGNYPFSTKKPNVGMVSVPDERLDVLAKMYASKRIVPAAMRFVDIAGLPKGASAGEGLGNKFLSYIREVDAIAQVVRCFDDGNVSHVEGALDPVRDIEIVNTELCIADLESIERRMERLQRQIKAADKQAAAEKELLLRVEEALSRGEPARRLEFTEEEQSVLKDANLLTMKPTLYVANIHEQDLAAGARHPLAGKVMEYAAREQAQAVALAVRLEEELSEIHDAQEFRQNLGIQESGLAQVIGAAYKLLNLISFLTAGESETRAWTIRRGTKARQAAGKIHTDIERGFIRAEIVSYTGLAASGSFGAAKEKGLVRLEGREYIMQDGDVVNFRFNV